jgi:peptidoglycan/xylan/chitin deacetylase (PgdA/CDA1 family)
LLLLLSGGAANAAVVFMYHRFGEDRYPSTSVRLEQFDAHLQHLDEAGYEVWPLERIVAYLRRGEELPDRVVALTIDDAYASIYEQAWPRLRHRGWPFTVFVATDPVDDGIRGYMSWAQMREMARAGVHFANHSRAHDKLHQRLAGESASAWEARVRADLAHAQARLREELGAAVPASPRLFAYPYGEYDARLTAIVADLGYIAFGQHSGAVGAGSDLYSLPRFPMAEAYAELGEFKQKAATLALPLSEIDPRDPVLGDGNNPPRFAATLGRVSGDPKRLNCFASNQGALEVQWLDAEGRRFAVQAAQPYRPGRARYNCTLPSRETGRFYWFSQPWIIPGDA